MNGTVVFLVGVGVGLVAAKLLITPGNSDLRVAMGVRDRVGSELGPVAQSAGDALGLWHYTPGLLNLFGVDP